MEKLNEWLNQDAFTPQEQLIVRETENKFLINKDTLKREEFERLLNNLSCLQLSEYNLSIWNSATQIIDYLLNQKLKLKEICAYGDNLHLQHLINVKYDLDENNKYCYVSLLPRERFNVLSKEELRKLKLFKIHNDCQLILDATNGFGFVDMDYSIFDYIIYSTHCITPYYRCGMLFSKNNEDVLPFNKNKIINDYNNVLELIMKRKHKIFTLKDIVRDVLKDKFEEIENNTDFVYSFKYKGDKKDYIKSKELYLKDNGIQMFEKDNNFILLIFAFENIFNNNLSNAINFLMEL